MKFKIDENLPEEAAAALRDAGFDAETIWDEGLVGSDDALIANRARAEGRILITLDLDFANIRAYPPREHPGLIVIRPGSQDKKNVIAVVKRLVLALRHRSPAFELWIVEEGRIRFRQGRASQ